MQTYLTNKAMSLNNLPDDINIELLLSYFPEGTLKVAMRGLHKRNTYNDIIDVDENKDGTIVVGVGRNSLYNTLPEFLFHPIDRFDSIPKSEEKERFADEYEKQEHEKEVAYKFFAPLDTMLLKLRVDVRERLRAFSEDNIVLKDILGDRLTEEQRDNRFIKQTLSFLPSCRQIRGNKTLLTFLLRKVFMEEGLRINVHKERREFIDSVPRYAESLDFILAEGYNGNAYEDQIVVYDVDYWSDDHCDAHFLQFLEDVEVFRSFIQDYFLAVGETLRFNISQDEAPMRVSDEIVYNYLNYNTNI